MPLRTLIVDDERPGRQRVHDLLTQDPGVEVIGACDNGEAATARILQDRPDLVFLDVHMPEISGLDVLLRVGRARMPLFIFVTAHDAYALQAFELAAVDYLLKPFNDERFWEALERAKRRRQLQQNEALRDELVAWMQQVAPSAGTTAASGPGYRERFAVEDRGSVRIITTDRIDYFAASGPYVELYSGGRAYLIRGRMQDIEALLDPRHFCRIHRSTIVNLRCVEALKPRHRGTYIAQLTGGMRLKVSRSRLQTLQERLGVEL